MATSHILVRKNVSHQNIEKKMHLFCFNGAYSLSWTFETYKSIYFLKVHRPNIPMVTCLNQMIQGVQIIQGGT